MKLGLFLALCAQLGSAAGSEDLLLKIGDPAPPFSMKDLEKSVFTLAQHVGPNPDQPRKAVMMAFFATWCEPCKKEIPIVKKLHAEWSAKGVEVVYVGLSQGQKELEPFAKEQKLPWRVVPDTFGLLARRYGASQLPHLFIIDKAGNVAFQHRGIAPELEKLLRDQLAAITGEAAGPAPSAAVVVPRFSTKYILGRAPSAESSGSRWQPLAVYLGEEVQAEIAIDADAASYEAFEKALHAGKYDIANAGPLLCHAVKDKYEPIAKIERQNNSGYVGILFVRRDSSVRGIADLEGKTVGLVAANSSSGGLYPQKALIDAGLVPGKDVTIKWLGSHTKVAEAVKKGEVDAGGCYEDCRDAVWKNAKEKGEASRILGYTAQIPPELIVVKKSLDPKVKSALKKSLAKVNGAEGILSQMSEGELTITSIVEAGDKDLAEVGRVVSEVAAKAK
jgi:phosphate/phosphite/phosphonate ABC transporter binding protein